MKTNITPLRWAALVMLMMAALLALDASLALAQQEDSKKDEAVYAPLAKVPAKAQAKRNPLENDPEAQAAGSKLFGQHCMECHGRKAEGTKRGVSLLQGPVQQSTPGALFWILTNGVVWHGMPPWSKLPEPQRWQIILYLRSLR